MLFPCPHFGANLSKATRDSSGSKESEGNSVSVILHGSHQIIFLESYSCSLGRTSFGNPEAVIRGADEKRNFS